MNSSRNIAALNLLSDRPARIHDHACGKKASHPDCGANCRRPRRSAEDETLYRMAPGTSSCLRTSSLSSDTIGHRHTSAWPRFSIQPEDRKVPGKISGRRYKILSA
jgi:hypothetical protein